MSDPNINVGLDPNLVNSLLAKRASGGRGGGKGSRGPRANKIDPDDRSYKAWFMYNQQLMDHETGEMSKCENPNCTDKSSRGQVTVLVAGKNMCRHCFIGGWLVGMAPTPSPELLATNSDPGAATPKTAQAIVQTTTTTTQTVVLVNPMSLVEQARILREQGKL